MRAEPGTESLTSRRPSELRDAPFSRPPAGCVGLGRVQYLFAQSRRLRFRQFSHCVFLFPGRGVRGHNQKPESHTRLRLRVAVSFCQQGRGRPLAERANSPPPAAANETRPPATLIVAIETRRGPRR